MIWALKDNQRIKAEPKIDGCICPLCLEPVISKCGEIKEWHWSHISLRYCDIWAEPETRWHIDWKNEFPKECQEVIMGKHRADVKLGNLVIEFQNSSISSKDIQKREEFYGNMIWLINGNSFGKNLIFRDKKDYYSFRWKHPVKSWWYAKKPIYVDFEPYTTYLKNQIIKYDSIKKSIDLRNDLHSDEVREMYQDEIDSINKEVKQFENKILRIKKIYPSVPCGGWGQLITKEDFLKEVKNGSRNCK